VNYLIIKKDLSSDIRGSVKIYEIMKFQKLVRLGTIDVTHVKEPEMLMLVLKECVLNNELLNV